MKTAVLFAVALLMSTATNAFEWKGNEEAACSKIINELVVAPTTFRVVNMSTEERGNLRYVSVRYETKNRFNVLLRETATCIFNQQWFKYQDGMLKCDPDQESWGLCLKDLLGPTPIEKICSAARCYDREEVATLWSFIDSGRVLPRTAPD
jgi:hypothetical protein